MSYKKIDLVSVIVPYFKNKKYIKNSITSVINQTYKNLQIIIIFDENTKENLNFIKKISKIDKRIELLVNKKNIGAGYSRNRGIKHAAGKYIAFIDADDTWLSDKLKDQIAFMKKNNYQISHTSYFIIDEKKKIIGQRKARDLLSINEILKSCDIGLSTVIIEKKVIVKTDTKFPKLVTKEDFVFWLTLMKKNYKFYAFDRNLTNWTDSKNSLSSSTIQKLFDGFKVYNKYMHFNILK